jgi:glycosyltransferase involved in cell wall biosynthesis
LKILQIIQRSQLRGAEIFACQLATELQKKGHVVDVLILFGKPDNTFSFLIPFKYLQANEKKRWRDFSGYKNLSTLIMAEDYDIVQANAGDTLKYAALSKKIYRWESKLIFRNANKISDFLKSNLKVHINKWLLKEVDFIASVSHECKKDFLKLFNIFHNKIGVLPIGVSLFEIQSPGESEIKNIHIKAPKILHVGGFVPEKNHVGLIRIFLKVRQSFPEANLLLVGQGKLTSDIEKLVAEHELSNHVFFLGKRNDVLLLMKSVDVFVLPSSIEGLPGVILEAFSQKLPVVAYDVGGISEIVVNDKTGWLIKKDDEESFAAAVKKVLTNDIHSITQEAYDLAANQYEISQIASAFLSNYQKLLES